jgi:predicted dienelactone hydrolase
MWCTDVAFVLDRLETLNASDPSGRFTGRLDLQHIGVVGHSFGGATAAEFCHEDSRCKAGVDLDGAPFGPVIQSGLRQPFMFVLSDQNGSGPEDQLVFAHIQSIYDRLPVDSRLRIKILGANHFSFSDQILLKSQVVLRLMRMMGVLRLDGRRGLAITADYVGTFFDAYLKGRSRAHLQALERKYPEVRIQ